MATKAAIAEWAHQVRIGASWMSGPRAKKLNALADEMDQASGSESTLVENPDARAQGETADKRKAKKEADAEK